MAIKRQPQPPANYAIIKRIVKYQCTDAIGQKGTFTTDENGKQNSPTFPSFYALTEWALKPCNYSFLAEMRNTKENYKLIHSPTQ